MSNHYIEGRAFLEGKRAGLFGESVAFCLEHGGVVHFSPDCLLLGIPCGDAPETLFVVFQHSHLPALRRVLLSLPFKRVRWMREWGHSAEYGVRERAISDFCRHKDFGTCLTKNDL